MVECMSNLLKSIIFTGLVFWTGLKRYFANCKYAIESYMETETPEDQRRKNIWGKSAPSLFKAPPSAVSNISLSSKVQSATIISESGCYQDCTKSFKVFIETHNTLSRPDIFHNSVNTFMQKDTLHYFGQFDNSEEEIKNLLSDDNDDDYDEEEKNNEYTKPTMLLVVYKYGMLTYSVLYNSDIVFPPSTSQKNMVKYKSVSIVKNGEVIQDITSLVKQLSGPSGDFYIESNYETTKKSILLYASIYFSRPEYMDYTNQELEIQYKNGQVHYLHLSKNDGAKCFLKHL